MDDSTIIDLYWVRSERAISETASKYGKSCYNISYNILYDKRDAEECVNYTWLGAWNSMPPKRPSRLSIFLYKITRNLSLDKYRKYNAEKRRFTRTAETLDELAECISGRDNVAEFIDETILTAQIKRFLYEQSTDKRNIFIRRYWYLDSIKEISEDYGISESKTISILFRLRSQLKGYLLREGIAL